MGFTGDCSGRGVNDASLEWNDDAPHFSLSPAG